MTSSRRALILAFALVFFASGCARWGGHPLPDPSSPRQLPDPLRVTRADHAVLVLRDAVIAGDSIVGYAGPERARAAVAIRDVRSMQRRRTDFLATAGLITSVYAVATVATLLVLLSAWG